MNKHQSIYVLLTFTFGALLVLIGSAALYYFTTHAKYMTQIGTQPLGSIAYDVKDVFLLLAFCFAAPIGFIFLLSAISIILRAFAYNKYATSSRVSTFVFTLTILATASAFITLSFFAFFWSHHVLQCGFIFCTGDSWPQPTAIEPPIGPDGEGFRSTIAAPAIIFSTVIALCFLAIFFHEFANSCFKSFQVPPTQSTYNSIKNLNNNDFNEKLLNQSLNDSSSNYSQMSTNSTTIQLPSYSPYNTTFQINSINGVNKKTKYNPNVSLFIRFSVQLLILFILLSSIYVVASYVPNQFRSYMPSYIAKFAKLEVVHDPERCVMSGKYSCPDRYKASFHTHQFQLSDNIVLKLFPSNSIFYTFIIFALLFPVVSRMIPTIDNILSRKIVLSLPSIFFLCNSRRKPVNTMTKTYWSLYEIFLTLWIMLGTYLFFSYCFFDRNWKERQATSDITTWWDNMMRSSGQVAVFFLALLMFPVARSSPILSLFGVGFDKAVNVHRWLGVVFLLVTILHMISAYLLFYSDAGWNGVLELLWPYPPLKVLENQDNFTIPLIQLVTWFTCITIGIISCYEPIRRKAYDFFLISHHITYLILIPTVLWHAQASWEYMLPPLAFYTGDRLLRLYRGVQSVALHSTFIKDFQPNPHVSTTNSYNSTEQQDDEENDQFSIFSPQSINLQRKLPQPITTIYAPKELHHIPVPSPGSANLSSQTNNVDPPGVRLLDYGDAGKYVELNVMNSLCDFVYFPGQFFFINIAEISLFEYHPMTTSSSIHSLKSNTLSFLIKCIGEKSSWTNKLYKYVEEITSKQLPSTQYHEELNIPLTVSLDGPYGQPVDFNKYENIILCAAGSGITPIKSVFESLWLSFLHDFVPGLTGDGKDKLKQQLMRQHFNTIQDNSSTTINTNSIILAEGNPPVEDVNKLFKIPKKVHMFFAARDPSLFECMSESLANIPKQGSPFSAELICSQQGELIPIQTDKDDFILNTPSIDYKVNVMHHLQHHFSSQHLQRSYGSTAHKNVLHLEESIRKGFDTADLNTFTQLNQKTIIFACGPQRLTDEAKALASKYNWSIHEELFEL